jgi:hypothetical protein
LTLSLLCAVLIPIVFTPLIADDFGGLFTLIALRDQAMPWDQQFKNSLLNINSGGHLNILGQFLAKITYKIWIEISQSLEIPLSYGFWVLKFYVYVFLIATLAVLLKRLGKDTLMDRLKMIAIGFGLFAINHALWSNDPIVSYPLAGIFSSTIGLIAIVCFLNNIKEPSLKNYSYFIIFSICAPLVYEINISIFAFFFTYIFLNRKFRKNSRVLAITLFAFSLSVLILLIVYISKPENASNYEGTTVTLESPFSFIRTLLFSFSSFLPFRAWSVTSIQNNVLILAATSCIIASISLYRFKFSYQSTAKETHFQYSRSRMSLAFIMWSVTAIGIQATTEKTQQEAIQWGFVYLFYSTVLISMVSILYIFRSEIFKVTPIYFILCMFILVNIFVNVNNTAILFKEYSANHAVTNVIFTTKTTNEFRCQIKNEWINSRVWPKYYEEEATQSFDVYSFRIRGKEFCEIV